MAIFIEKPTKVEAAGNIPKIIEEFIGCVNSGNSDISIAKMTSPEGWHEPGQTPTFDEFTVVLQGELHVETREQNHVVRAGQAIIAKKGEWVRYHTPVSDTQYIAVCLPAFTPDTVNRDEE